MTAAMREQVTAAYAGALERRKTERYQPYRTFSRAEELRAELDGVTLERGNLYAEYRPPRSAAEWLDDRVIEAGGPGKRGVPECLIPAAVAAAARDGEPEAALRAVAEARQLTPARQWAAYQTLTKWKGANDAVRFGADRILGQALAEWTRLRLATGDPAVVAARRTRRRRDTEEVFSG